MSKETENLLRVAVIVMLFLLLLMVAIKRISNLEERIKELESAPADTVTVIQHDTIKIDSPIPMYKYIKEKEYIQLSDTLFAHDTVKELVFLPREYLVYKDSTYRAVVSGVQPRLDSIEIYRPTITNTITKTVPIPDRKRWGLGINAGAGWNGREISPYIGVGVQYNIIRW